MRGEVSTCWGCNEDIRFILLYALQHVVRNCVCLTNHENQKKHRTLAAADADAKRAQDDDVGRKEKEEVKRLKDEKRLKVQRLNEEAKAQKRRNSTKKKTRCKD